MRPAGVGVSFCSTTRGQLGTSLGQLFGDCLVDVGRQLNRWGYTLDEVVDLIITVTSIEEWFASVGMISQAVFARAIPAATLIEQQITPLGEATIPQVTLEGVAVHSRES